MQWLAEILQARTSRIFRLPEPEAPEETGDLQERHSHAGADLLRMAARMQRALMRLGLREKGSALLLGAPTHTLEQFVSWLAAVAAGHRVWIAETPDKGARLARSAPDRFRVLICPPSHKAQWQELARRTGAKLATLGGHWQGSFFMLQMVQPETEMIRTETPGETAFANGPPLAPATLHQQASALAAGAGLSTAPAIVLSAPVLQAPSCLIAALAALMTDAPLYWLAPPDREPALRHWPALPPHAALLADGSWLAELAARRGSATLRREMRLIDIDGLSPGD